MQDPVSPGGHDGSDLLYFPDYKAHLKAFYFLPYNPERLIYGLIAVLLTDLDAVLCGTRCSVEMF